MSNFDLIYHQTVEIKGGSPDLRPLLQDLYDAIIKRPIGLPQLKNAMKGVLQYLTTPSGRTKENLASVDLFMCLEDNWERRWSDLPEPYQDVLMDMGGALHDTITAPDIAGNFESTPEQLLVRTRTLPE